MARIVRPGSPAYEAGPQRGRSTFPLHAIAPSWTNEEGDGGMTVTTVTFDEIDGRTLVVVHDLYPSKGALDAASGSTGAMPEALDQLDELLVSLGSTTTQ